MISIKSLKQYEGKYDEQILARVENGFNRVLPFAAIAAFATSVLIYFSNVAMNFAIMDFIVGVIFMIMTVFSKKIDVRFKIVIMMTVAIVIGVLSFLDGAFNSAFITLILLANIVAVMFLERKTSIVFSILTSGIFVVVVFLSRIMDIGAISEIEMIYIIVHFVVYCLYLMILHVSVYSIRAYLTDNMSELESSMEKTKTLAYYDQLTGLPNAYKFKQDLVSSIKNNGFLVFFNLKNLSLINSIYGEHTGDKVLIEMIKTIQRITSRDSYIARINGNEFVYWVEETDELHLERKLKRLMSKFYEVFYVPKMSKKLEFTISLADLNNPTANIMDCYQQGLAALSYAKRNNISGFVQFDDRINTQMIFEENIKDNLEMALQKRELTLHYQPKMDAVNEVVVGVEALARWDSPVMGKISPSHFIKIIEEANMSVLFGEYIIDYALGEYPYLCDKYGDDITISINISPEHLVDKHFVDYVIGTIEQHKVPYERVILEITEDIMIQDLDLVQKVISALRVTGVEISLDDFGSGYSSLNYLTHLDLNELKIDKSFIDQIEENNKISIMLSNIINLSNEYGLRVVSEGVETEKQKDQLIELGCQLIQGYYYAKPEAL